MQERQFPREKQNIDDFCAEQEKKKKSIKKTKKGLTNRFFYVIMSIAKIEG